MPLILVGGGARSGKSRYALSLAKARGRRLAFLATAEAFDDEMRDRIAQHRTERDGGFVTLEEPYDVSSVIAEHASNYDAIVMDCLTLWLTNLMLAERYDLAAEYERLVKQASDSPCAVIAVTNEVGCGIVPDNELSRRFRDEAGRLNQRAAEAAVEVHWMIFGCPFRVK